MKNFIIAMFTALGLAFSVQAQEAADNGVQRFDIAQTVVKMPLEEGVSVADALDFMRSKASELNMKIVAHQPVSEELKARGVDSGPLHIMQFCNPGDAHRMVTHNAIFAAYMPCRIALVEDSEDKVWLMMLDLNLLIDNTPLPPDMKEMAQGINGKLLQIMEAGAKGTF